MATTVDFSPDSLTTLFDDARAREIPLAIYRPSDLSVVPTPVIFNHGYDKHREINAHSYLDYGYLCRTLADAGYYVISIRHDLDSDPLLSMEKPYKINRMSSWKKGEQNILFVIDSLKKLYPHFNWEKLTLIGHSNGGDMVMLTITNHPDLAFKVVSLDHRRMPIPRTIHPNILSLRGCDYPADAGVLPNLMEQKEYGIKIISMPDVRHSDFGLQGTDLQHSMISDIVLQFMR